MAQSKNAVNQTPEEQDQPVLRPSKAERTEKDILIRPPRFGFASIAIKGDILVVHRASKKLKDTLTQKMETGKAAQSKKNREPQNTDDLFNEARYISPENWDGFNASGVRKAMISACRLVNFKMTLAKLSLFVEPDGWDKLEPQIPLIRIRDCEPIKQMDMAKVETGQPYITVRPAYHHWRAVIKLRWDEDQFTASDIVNLLARAGAQVGICEGRPDSKESSGMGWGLFELDQTENGDISVAA